MLRAKPGEINITTAAKAIAKVFPGGYQSQPPIRISKATGASSRGIRQRNQI